MNKTLFFIISFMVSLLIWGLIDVLSFQSLVDVIDKKDSSVYAIPVKVTSVKVGSLTQSFDFTATIKAKQFVKVFPPNDLRIIKVIKRKGEKVQEKEVIAHLERENLELEIYQQEATIQTLTDNQKQEEIQLYQTMKESKVLKLEITNARQSVSSQKERVYLREKKLDRLEKLLRESSLSEDDYNQALEDRQEAKFLLQEKKLELQKREQALEQHPLKIELAKTKVSEIKNKINQQQIILQKMKRDLEKTYIKAPISGVLTDFQLQVGEKVSVSTPVFSVISREQLEVTVDIPQRYLAQIKKGQSVRVMNEVMMQNPSPEYQGVVALIHPVIDEKRGTIPIGIDIFPQFNDHFLPGMFVTTQIIVAQSEPLIMIPKKARLFEKHEPFVFRVKHNQVEKVFLDKTTVSMTDKFHYGVSKKISSGDLIVVSGQSRLLPGSFVSYQSGEEK